MDIKNIIKDFIDPGSYCFDDILMIIDGFPGKCPATSEFPFRLKRAADQYTAKVGADGTYHFSRGLDKGGTLEVDIMANSPLNLYLELVVASEDAGLSKDVFFMIKNLKRLDIATGMGRITKPADTQFGKTESERTWTILLRELHMITGSGKGIL